MMEEVNPETVKPAPVMATALTVTAEVPVEERVKDWVVGVFRTTLPKAMEAVLTLSVGTVDTASCTAKVFVTLLALAVKVAV